MTPCMGGFCGKRDSCPNYHAPTFVGDEPPAERLCGPTDGLRKAEIDNEPLSPAYPLKRNSGVRDRILGAMAGWMTCHEVSEAIDVPLGTVKRVLRKLCEEGLTERVVKDKGGTWGQAPTLFRLKEAHAD